MAIQNCTRTILALLLAISFSVVTAAAAAAADEPAAGLTAGEVRGGWKPLFDGKTTSGWRNYRSDSLSTGWKVHDGILERADQGAGDIVTTLHDVNRV